MKNGISISPICGFLVPADRLIDIPFFIAGTLKIAYDLCCTGVPGDPATGGGRLMAGHYHWRVALSDTAMSTVRRSLIAILVLAASLPGQTLKQIATIDLPGPKASASTT